jgi:hypothetical protein
MDGCTLRHVTEGHVGMCVLCWNLPFPTPLSLLIHSVSALEVWLAKHWAQGSWQLYLSCS